MRFWNSTSSSHLEVLFGQTACHIAENGSNKCRFSLWIGTIVRPFCNHNETEMLVNTTTLVHLLLLSRKFWFLVPREGLFSEKNVLRGQICGKWAISEVVDNQLVLFSLHFIALSKLCNELVGAMLWDSQSYHLSGSKHSSERLRCHMWQFRMWKMRKMEWKNGFPTHVFFLNWTEKSTKICRVFSLCIRFFLAFAFDILYLAKIHPLGTWNQCSSALRKKI